MGILSDRRLSDGVKVALLAAVELGEAATPAAVAEVLGISVDALRRRFKRARIPLTTVVDDSTPRTVQSTTVVRPKRTPRTVIDHGGRADALAYTPARNARPSESEFSIYKKKFKEFWDQHAWVKAGRGKAFSALLAHVAIDELDEFLENAQSWADYYRSVIEEQRGSTLYVVHESTWIREHYWRDKCRLQLAPRSAEPLPAASEQRSSTGPACRECSGTGLTYEPRLTRYCADDGKPTTYRVRDVDRTREREQRRDPTGRTWRLHEVAVRCGCKAA